MREGANRYNLQTMQPDRRFAFYRGRCLLER
jgi:hypothetical protein